MTAFLLSPSWSPAVIEKQVSRGNRKISLTTSNVTRYKRNTHGAECPLKGHNGDYLPVVIPIRTCRKRQKMRFLHMRRYPKKLSNDTASCDGFWGSKMCTGDSRYRNISSTSHLTYVLKSPKTLHTAIISAVLPLSSRTGLVGVARVVAAEGGTFGGIAASPAP